LGIKFEPVAIGRLERFVADWHNANSKEITKKPLNNGKKIAIVGSGPSGLACAEKLIELGYDVDVYDKYHKAGGILTYGIPDFVLPKDVVDSKISYLENLGVNFLLSKEMNVDFTLEELKEKYDAIYLAFGAGLSKRMEVKNNDLMGIIDANLFLMKAYENDIKDFENCNNVIVVGGGNTAIDAALVAKNKLNKNVTIVYRRSEKEMPARKDEFIKAKNNGVNFAFLTNPVCYHGESKLEEVECIKMELVASNEGRARPVEIKDSNFKIKCDLLIEAISSYVDDKLTTSLNTHSWGGIIIDENSKTSNEKVFAGGDCVRGPSLVVLAMVDGIKAAQNINEYIRKANFK
jgi:glutamate synthase (NADPH/NADH) small chain